MAKRTWKRRLILLALWAALAGAALLALFRYAQHWTPPREEFPVQGLSVSALSGPVVWNMVKAQGVDFVYIRSSSGAKARDAAFATHLEGDRKSVGGGKRVSVRVDRGGRRVMKKKKQ